MESSSSSSTTVNSPSTTAQSRSLAASKAGKTPWLDKNGTDIADIFVGCPEVLYRYSKRKLCKAVPHFAILLGDASSVKLPEVGCEAFDLLMEYVESDCVRRAMARALTSIRQMSMIPPSEGTFNESCDPISFFSLAEKLELPALQNLVMDTTIQCHKDNRQLPSIDFAERAFDETRNGSTISKYAVRAMRYFLQVQAQDNDHDWTMGAMADVLGNHRSISIEFLDLVRQGAIKDPRKTSRDFHVPLAPADVHTPSQNRIAPSVTPSGQVSSKRQRSVHQAKSRTKRQRIDVPVRHEPVANEGRVKQEYSGSNSILGDLGGEKTTAVGGQELLARILDDERMVFNILLDEPQHGHGLHVKDIAKKSAGLTVNDVFKAGDVLLGEGLIYTTADNETWAVLEY